MSAAESVELEVEIGSRSVSFDLHEELYPRDVVHGAAYLFVDRAYVFLTRPGDAQVRVRLRTKEATDEDGLLALAGEFANELLNQLVRKEVGASTSAIREYTLARALFGHDQRASIDALLAELDREELDADGLEISVPWDTAGGASGG